MSAPLFRHLRLITSKISPPELSLFYSFLAKMSLTSEIDIEGVFT